jgi:hypothetical protein
VCRSAHSPSKRSDDSTEGETPGNEVVREVPLANELHASSEVHHLKNQTNDVSHTTLVCTRNGLLRTSNTLRQSANHQRMEASEKYKRPTPSSPSERQTWYARG